jgi:hypothetical protein
MRVRRLSTPPAFDMAPSAFDMAPSAFDRAPSARSPAPRASFVVSPRFASVVLI